MASVLSASIVGQGLRFGAAETLVVVAARWRVTLRAHEPIIQARRSMSFSIFMMLTSPQLLTWFGAF